jgi:hypothetical protein
MMTTSQSQLPDLQVSSGSTSAAEKVLANSASSPTVCVRLGEGR